MILNPSMNIEGMALSKLVKASHTTHLTALIQRSVRYDGLYDTLLTRLSQDVRVSLELFDRKGIPCILKSFVVIRLLSCYSKEI